MACDRLYLVCNKCNGAVMLYKWWHNSYVSFANDSYKLTAFINKHIEDCYDNHSEHSMPEDAFRLVTENSDAEKEIKYHEKIKVMVIN